MQMEELQNKENSIKVIYGEESLKEIVTDLLEKAFIEYIKDKEKCK